MAVKKKEEKKSPKPESRIEKGLKVMLRYNDYALVILCLETFLLVHWTKDDASFKDVASFLQVFFINFLFVKQVAQQLYYDVTVSHALKSQKIFTIDLRDEKPEEEEAREFSIARNLLETVVYTIADTVLMAALLWMFGSSVLT